MTPLLKIDHILYNKFTVDAQLMKTNTSELGYVRKSLRLQITDLTRTTFLPIPMLLYMYPYTRAWVRVTRRYIHTALIRIGCTYCARMSVRASSIIGSVISLSDLFSCCESLTGACKSSAVPALKQYVSQSIHHCESPTGASESSAFIAPKRYVTQNMQHNSNMLHIGQVLLL